MLLLPKWYSVLPSWNAVKPLWELVILGISSERVGFLIIMWRTLLRSISLLPYYNQRGKVPIYSTYLEPAKSLVPPAPSLYEGTDFIPASETDHKRVIVFFN